MPLLHRFANSTDFRALITDCNISAEAPPTFDPFNLAPYIHASQTCNRQCLPDKLSIGDIAGVLVSRFRSAVSFVPRYPLLSPLRDNISTCSLPTYMNPVDHRTTAQPFNIQALTQPKLTATHLDPHRILHRSSQLHPPNHPPSHPPAPQQAK